MPPIPSSCLRPQPSPSLVSRYALPSPLHSAISWNHPSDEAPWLMCESHRNLFWSVVLPVGSVSSHPCCSHQQTKCRSVIPCVAVIRFHSVSFPFRVLLYHSSMNISCITTCVLMVLSNTITLQMYLSISVHSLPKYHSTLYLNYILVVDALSCFTFP